MQYFFSEGGGFCGVFGAPHARTMYLSLVNNLEMIKKSFEEVPMLTHHEKSVFFSLLNFFFSKMFLGF